MKLLQINGSARRVEQGAISTLLANELSAALLAAHPGSRATVRDLAVQPHPMLDEAALSALFTPAEQRSPAQAARVTLDDLAIEEIQAADTLVLGVPMYNFGISSQLKNWFDAIARARVTFRYTAHGAEGLLTGKTVYAVLARGGIHRDQPSDTIVPYLRTLLDFLGMTDVHFIYAEGLALGPEAQAKALAEARAEIARLTTAR
ncbi:NAD(P)H-dependent oxidoreductase [Ideonella sp. B7]|uniref:FMN-dependent NADH-azoreductase n=1 Tax=Ideonella benzenivorans TaxID=2831643 RepID=UPI001CEDB911|nr:NAD(P)H-dependent oxidoreductase [Ideonella benzenivorans]MCA6218381.1 NAD(P)H-dependent oxidoreductase [Ideonella benzenivorans]